MYSNYTLSFEILFLVFSSYLVWLRCHHFFYVQIFHELFIRFALNPFIIRFAAALDVAVDYFLTYRIWVKGPGYDLFG